MDGTIWIADAPVPTTATRSPSSRWSWSHRAEWNTVPPNVESPGSDGTDGDTSAPVPSTRNRAVNTPLLVVILHCDDSQVASRTSWPHRIRPSRPASAAMRRRYAQISGCAEYVSDHVGLGAKENEYRCDGTSQRHPG